MVCDDLAKGKQDLGPCESGVFSFAYFFALFLCAATLHKIGARALTCFLMKTRRLDKGVTMSLALGQGPRGRRV